MAKIQIRRDTAARWASFDPVLSSGELGYDTTNDIVKIGDGASTWSELDPITQDVVTSHADLTERDSADQHPISAITDLQDALDNASGFDGAADVAVPVSVWNPAVDPQPAVPIPSGAVLWSYEPDVDENGTDIAVNVSGWITNGEGEMATSGVVISEEHLGYHLTAVFDIGSSSGPWHLIVASNDGGATVFGYPLPLNTRQEARVLELVADNFVNVDLTQNTVNYSAPVSGQVETFETSATSEGWSTAIPTPIPDGVLVIEDSFILGSAPNSDTGLFREKTTIRDTNFPDKDHLETAVFFTADSRPQWYCEVIPEGFSDESTAILSCDLPVRIGEKATIQTCYDSIEGSITAWIQTQHESDRIDILDRHWKQIGTVQNAELITSSTDMGLSWDGPTHIELGLYSANGGGEPDRLLGTVIRNGLDSSPWVEWSPVGKSIGAESWVDDYGNTWNAYSSDRAIMLWPPLEADGTSFEQSTPANWTTDPNTVQAALDELASRIAALEP